METILNSEVHEHLDLTLHRKSHLRRLQITVPERINDVDEEAQPSDEAQIFQDLWLAGTIGASYKKSSLLQKMNIAELTTNILKLSDFYIAKSSTMLLGALSCLKQSWMGIENDIQKLYMQMISLGVIMNKNKPRKSGSRSKREERVQLMLEDNLESYHVDVRSTKKIQPFVLTGDDSSRIASAIGSPGDEWKDEHQNLATLAVLGDEEHLHIENEEVLTMPFDLNEILAQDHLSGYKTPPIDDLSDKDTLRKDWTNLFSGPGADSPEETAENMSKPSVRPHPAKNQSKVNKSIMPVRLNINLRIPKGATLFKRLRDVSTSHWRNSHPDNSMALLEICKKYDWRIDRPYGNVSTSVLDTPALHVLNEFCHKKMSEAAKWMGKEGDLEDIQDRWRGIKSSYEVNEHQAPRFENSESILEGTPIREESSMGGPSADRRRGEELHPDAGIRNRQEIESISVEDDRSISSPSKIFEDSDNISDIGPTFSKATWALKHRIASILRRQASIIDEKQEDKLPTVKLHHLVKNDPQNAAKVFYCCLVLCAAGDIECKQYEPNGDILVGPGPMMNPYSSV